MTTCFACKLPWTMLPFQMRAYTLKGKNLLLMSRFFALRVEPSDKAKMEITELLPLKMY